ncbi:MAG: hypothetical protein ABI787_03940 [Spartobacteria bacterium]
MKTIQQILLCTALFFVALVTTVPAAPALSIQIVGTFDYPGAISTSPIGINDRGEITGHYLDANNVTRGFVRLRNGTFRPPIVEPNDNGNMTRGQRINNSRVVCGFYSGNSNLHGFLLSGNVFSEFDVPGAPSTFIFALNDAGNFVGSYGDLSTLGAYVNLGGVTSTFTVGGSGVTEPLGINGANEIVGFYFDTDFSAHGFFRDASGAQTFPMDFPGSTYTFLVDLNDNGLMVGAYGYSTGGSHGFVINSTGQSVSFDYPGATDTGINGINNGGMMCGRYTDSAGVPHGFIARVR